MVLSVVGTACSPRRYESALWSLARLIACEAPHHRRPAGRTARAHAPEPPRRVSGRGRLGASVLPCAREKSSRVVPRPLRACSSTARDTQRPLQKPADSLSESNWLAVRTLRAPCGRPRACGEEGGCFERSAAATRPGQQNELLPRTFTNPGRRSRVRPRASLRATPPATLACGGQRQLRRERHTAPAAPRASPHRTDQQLRHAQSGRAPGPPARASTGRRRATPALDLESRTCAAAAFTTSQNFILCRSTSRRDPPTALAPSSVRARRCARVRFEERCERGPGEPAQSAAVCRRSSAPLPRPTARSQRRNAAGVTHELVRASERASPARAP